VEAPVVCQSGQSKEVDKKLSCCRDSRSYCL